jgi:hypothetical protein
MANPTPKTITYSESLQGWTSFHSYEPEWMAGMNNDFYTFKGGKVWKHHTNQVRNQYYGEDFDTVIQTVLNASSDSPKMFKTLKLKGKSDIPWSASVVSDLNDGFIPVEGYEKKEGNWYGYVRRNEGDLDLKYLSTLGLGIVAATATIGDEVQINIVGDVSTGVSQKTVASVGPPIVDARDNGDLLFDADIVNNTITNVGTKLGQVKTISYNPNTDLTTIVMVKHPEASGAPTPPAIGKYLISAKNSTAESYGLRGAYMDITLTSSEKDEVELLLVASEVFKSYQ